MKYTKLIAAGMTAAMVFGGASAVLADNSFPVNSFPANAFPANALQTNTFPEDTETNTDMEKMENEIDMSGLDLPEDFVPFDEAHVPDGIHIPENGELKPIEFDDEGNMIYGQKPDGEFPGRPGEFPGMRDGERPELPEGEMPAFGDGERPELPEGEMPAFGDGEFPGMNAGEQTAMSGGFHGGMTGMPQGGSVPFGNGSLQ